MDTILIFGANGQVGFELLRTAWMPGLAPVGLTRADGDVTDPRAVAAAMAAHRPVLVVNASAYTAVDRAESEPDAAFAVNRDGPAHLAQACAAAGVPLIHISTDYVFDGTSKATPWREDDPVAPQGVYAASKLAGEEAVRSAQPDHVILRTAWVFGAHGHNFVKTMLRLARERDELRVVADQHGCPTPAAAIAATIAVIAQARLGGAGWTPGTFHYAGAPATTWHGFADRIVERAAARIGRRPRVTAITTAEFPTPARRPANSVLDTARLGRAYGVAPADWMAGLDRMLDGILGETQGEDAKA
ncbi:dTDP-4-dehydrorhamnose reductase [Azospirillum formosense]|uniref:dTDP-4-dehydrorhamnose reductase n=1 Tax=Azospirillum formosense TaxID=861533 RepID=A0ABX2L2X4_9PROT|nr:dTDP-4-dehydrorhamnose reductase [Azospirillum formosense]MBY3757559.1 dTDP-4-dehydrorhamnose reductase [Azospirillum formosense]MBY3757685.1 dTDP-4-dehydrorhamnose reductase [Azospirillum formosense]NUB19530.1 dTDP-4-dehydrorhamnose reductase [Azospirillum formosense]